MYRMNITNEESASSLISRKAITGMIEKDQVSRKSPGSPGITDTDARCHNMLKSKVDPRAIIGGLLVVVALVGLFINGMWPLWLALMAAGMVLLTLTLTNQYEYECQKCHRRYKLGFMGTMLSRHGRDASGAWAISRCPHCRAITKARELRSNEQEKV